MSSSAKKWYALYTKPGQEKKVANLLSRRNIENYCPLKRQWNGRKKLILEPLFSSFVFVQISENEMKNVRLTDSVLNFVYWLGKPAVIRDEELEIMKRFMNEYTDIAIEKIPFNVNGMMRNLGGLEDGTKSHMISVKNNTVKIILPSLGYMMVAEIEKPVVSLPKPGVQSFTPIDNYRFVN